MTTICGLGHDMPAGAVLCPQCGVGAIDVTPTLASTRQLPPPGWYTDPDGTGSRWWDGAGWTDVRLGRAEPASHASQDWSATQQPPPERKPRFRRLDPIRRLGFPRPLRAILGMAIVVLLVPQTIERIAGHPGGYGPVDVGPDPNAPVVEYVSTVIFGVVLILMARAPLFVEHAWDNWKRLLGVATVGWVGTQPQPVVWWSARTVTPNEPVRTFGRVFGVSLLAWLLFMGMGGTFSLNLDSKAGDVNAWAFVYIVLVWGFICGLGAACYSKWGRTGYFAYNAILLLLLGYRSHHLREQRRQQATMRAQAQMNAEAYAALVNPPSAANRYTQSF